MTFYDLTVAQVLKMLRNLDRWLEAAAAFAERKKFDPAVLLKARLAPDQFALDKQVQIACDNAKNMAARLCGKDLPPHADGEATIAELRQRIASVASYLESFRPEDFAGAEERKITLPWMEDGKWMRPDDYISQFALANFYFHVTTAYAILRHNGVELGKRDFIGGVPLRSGTER
ncbi:MAG: DUF1993 domain-containing protein [Proteobacteria bacterium]|nr:DUF1993 domain-containing protein [Pseudomonadota bacterium]